MKHPQPLSDRQQRLMTLYSQCTLGMTPQRFYAKWAVSHEQLSDICSRSLSTVRRWFQRGRYHRRPTTNDLRHLALMDLLLARGALPPELVETGCQEISEPEEW